MKSSLRINGIDVRYDASDILSGITFDIARGDFVGIIGPNGCGKTTLLRAISRVHKPSAGAVLLDDLDIYSLSTKNFARELAVVPQDTSPAFDFTALEVVLMGRSPHLSRFRVEGVEDRKIAEEAMKQTRTLHLAERPINTMSGGELQRVVIARGLAQQPQVLLLDEPTSHLDLSYQFEVLDLVKKLNREQSLTVLAVLHDLNLAAQYCDRLILMGSGSIQAMGKPEEVITTENVRRVYGAEVWVRKHPASGRPYIIAGVSGNLKRDDRTVERRRVHIICGGGTGAPIMAKLLRRGYEVTAGVLNIGDTDLEVAESLGIESATCPPFTAVSDESEVENIRLIDASDAVVLSDLPFGQWNIPNLEAARHAMKQGKPLFLLRPDTAADRDFTGGIAPAVLSELVRNGAVSASSPDDAADHLDQMLS